MVTSVFVENPQMENNFQFISAAVSDRGLSDKRPQNEDSYIALEQVGLFAVADGVGGAQAGDVASQMAVEMLGEAFIHYGDTVDPEEIMKVAIERANEAVYQTANDLPQLSSMATTLAAIHISGNIATIAHVGDSRVYRVDPEGFLHRETEDHSVVEEEVRAGRMTREQAANHPSRNVISRAVGAESTVEVDIRTIMVDPGTIFLLCTDGITRHIDDEEIGELLTTGMSPMTLCAHMKEVCFERGAEDNLTAIIVKVTPAVTAAPTIATPELAEIDPTAEEETIAAARSPFDSPADEPPDEIVEIPPAQTVTPPQLEVSQAASDDTEQFLIEDVVEPEDAVQSEYSSSSVVVTASQPAPAPDRDLMMFGSRAGADVLPERTSGNIANTLLMPILWLVIGGIIGLAASYLWQSTNPIPQTEPPQISEMKTGNIPLTAFEENRRLVDRDPVAYANTRAASPQDAEDHYLLGRALLLSGKYFEARRQFAQAKEKLADADPANAKTLSADIAMANSIIESAQAQEIFKKEVEGLAAPARSDTNANAAGNSNTLR